QAAGFEETLEESGLGSRLELESVLPAAEPPLRPLAQPTPAEHLAAEEAWKARREREVQTLGGLHVATATGLAHETDPEPDGDGLRVVDYKTDQVALKEVDERFAGYRLQGAAYALLAAGVTGRHVTRVDFVFTDSGEVRSLAGAELAVQVAEIRTRLERAPG